MHKFIEQIEEINLLKENEINLIKNMIISELSYEEKIELEIKTKKILNEKIMNYIQN